MKSKVLENKKIKEEKLLNSALELFTANDIKDITIQDIVNKAGVAKGTFYLYFRDKYQIQDALVRKESLRIFENAQKKYKEKNIENFEEGIIYLVDQILLTLQSNPLLLRFIRRNLSWGIFQSQINSALDENTLHVIDDFTNSANQANYHYDNPHVILYIIIEMISSTCYNSILYNQPLPIESFKPILFSSIRAILHQGKVESE